MGCGGVSKYEINVKYLCLGSSHKGGFGRYTAAEILTLRQYIPYCKREVLWNIDASMADDAGREKF